MKFSLVGLSTMISLMFYFVPNKGRVLSSSADKESILFLPSINPFATFTWSLSELGNIPKCDQGTRPSICWAGRAIYLLFRWKFAVFFREIEVQLGAVSAEIRASRSLYSTESLLSHSLAAFATPAISAQQSWKGRIILSIRSIIYNWTWIKLKKNAF